MHGIDPSVLWLLFLLGGVLTANVLIKGVSDRLGIPSLLSFLLLGVLLSWTDNTWNWIDNAMVVELEFLARLGLVALLFKVGLDSDIVGLLDQLSEAVWIWLGNLLLSIAVGYLTASYVLDFGFIPSIIVAIAFSATSVGIPADVWEETNQLDSPSGEVFVDVAELDDLSAVILMALLFVTLPELRNQGTIEITVIARKLRSFLLHAVLFGGFCVAFSRYLEKPLSDFVSDFQPDTGPLLTMVGLGIIIATLSVLLGFSLAIGALFAGMIFSRDPVMIREEASFQVLYDFFTPFFFLVIGFNVNLNLALTTLWPAIVFLFAAVIGKFLGAGLPAYLLEGKRTGLLLGISMIPRAEIMLIIMKRGLEMGDWAVSESLYGSIILTAIGTCLVGTVWLRRELHHQSANAS